MNSHDVVWYVSTFPLPTNINQGVVETTISKSLHMSVWPES
jgi:hypothetical protein